MKQIYLDNGATSFPKAPGVGQAMKDYIEKIGVNVNRSSYRATAEAALSTLTVREDLCRLFDAGEDPSYAIFTSGVTMSLNMIMKGVLHPGDHLIISGMEHNAVARPATQLQAAGVAVSIAPCDETGVLRLAEFEKLFTPQTRLVVMQYASNVSGTIQPIAELAAIAHAHGAWFHTDAVQAVGHIPVDVKALGVDMLSLSGHKFHAPKGVGALYIKKGITPDIFMDGGGQEKGRRAGTENIASIVGLGEALTLANENLEANAAKITALRNRLIDELLKLPKVRLNGDRLRRLPGNCNLSFEGIEGESLLLRLDMAGICASSGSACTSGSLDPSHVLMAIGLPHEVAHGSLRLSLSELTTEEDIDYILAQVPPIVEGLRAMSPVWEKIKDK